MMRVGPLASGSVSPLQFLLLLQLNQGPKYGYEMLKFLRDAFEGVWDIRTGSFYPALKSLESKEFVETTMKEETEFYSLTSSGEALLNSFGDRIEIRSKFMNRYFKAMFKLMPLNLRTSLLGIFRKMTEDQTDIYSAQIQFLNESMSKDAVLEFLDEIKATMENRLEMLDALQHRIKEGN